MQSLQQSSNNDILSKELMSVFRKATSNNQPSGISPSKAGKRTIPSYGFSLNGNVKLTGWALPDDKYSDKYSKGIPYQFRTECPLTGF